MTMSEYFAKMENIADQYAMAGCFVSEEDLVLYILAGLGSEYDPIICSITTRNSTDHLSLKKIHALLLNQESRIEQLYATNSDSHHLSSNFSAHKNGGNHGRGKGNSNHQGRGKRRNEGFFGRRNDNKPICQICGKQGHIALTFWHIMDESFQPTSFSTSSSNNYKTTVCMATPDIMIDPSWYADSGATNHVTVEMNNLSLKKPYEGHEKLMIGNGKSLDITHIGHSYLPIPYAKSLHLKNILGVPKITKNLVNISKLTADNHIFIEFHSEFCIVKDKTTKNVLLRGRLKDGLYLLIEPQPTIASQNRKL